MSAFLKSIDSKTWKAVVKGWEHPVALDKNGNKANVLKSEEEWTTTEDESSLANSRALNAIFNGVDKSVFRMVKQCSIAKEAWEILKVTYKGTSKVKRSRLHLLTTQFESLTMKEDESIQEFHMNILDIANAFDTLEEKMSEEKPVRKILRSLPKRFDMKITNIEEAQDISKMKVEELIGSLQNFEIIINNKVEKEDNKAPSVFNAGIKETYGNLENDENLAESVVLLGKLFNKIVSLANWKSRADDQNIRSNIKEKQKSFSTSNEESEFKEVQCRECEGFGHIETGCSTFYNKQKKSVDDAWPKVNGSERMSEGMSIRKVTALTGRVYSDNESCDEELEYDDLATSYKDLYA